MKDDKFNECENEQSNVSDAKHSLEVSNDSFENGENATQALILNSSSNEDDYKAEPCNKKQKLMDCSEDAVNENDAYAADVNHCKEKLVLLSRTVRSSLDVILTRVKNLHDFSIQLDDKINILSEMVEKNINNPISVSSKDDDDEQKTVIVPVQIAQTVETNEGSKDEEPTLDGSNDKTQPKEKNINIVTSQFGEVIILNKYEDFPDGSWLGDPNDSKSRVRCSLTAQNLLHVEQEGTSAEKMALLLVDFLFDREVQAVSNISGTGKHRRRRLDPVLIYGIQCHLKYRFSITDLMWHRIKQNINSKCRSAARRKQKGLPLNPRTHLGNVDKPVFDTGESLQQQDLSYLLEHAQVISTNEGDVRVLEATPEQIAQLQESNQLQISDVDPSSIITIAPHDDDHALTSRNEIDDT